MNSQINRLKEQLQKTNRQLQDVLQQNEQYKNYIESLLEYNQKLVLIIQKQLKIVNKLQSNLHPISQRTQNDSEMVSDNRSISMRAMRTSSAVLESQKPNGNVIQLQEIEEEAQQPQRAHSERGHEPEKEIQLYGAIDELVKNYQQTYIDKREYFKNAFNSIINGFEQDKEKFREFHNRNMRMLSQKERELQELLLDLRNIDTDSMINRIVQKNRQIIQDKPPVGKGKMTSH